MIEKLLWFLFPLTMRDTFEAGSKAGCDFTEDRTRVIIKINGNEFIHLTLAEWANLNRVRGDESHCLRFSLHCRDVYGVIDSPCDV